jgi:RNA 2',3'-cyclic 3'-phosphodiesterase
MLARAPCSEGRTFSFPPGVRLFFAIELPPEVQGALGRLKPGDANADYRWVDPALLHLTLAFLGEQPEERLETLHNVGLEAAAASHGGQLRLGQVGQFGSKRSPRVLWVDLAGDLEALLALQRRLEQRLREAGFALETREFRPHVTLARRRETARGGPPPGWPPSPPDGSFPLRQLTLMQSRLSPRGPTYTPVFHFPIG